MASTVFLCYDGKKCKRRFLIMQQISSWIGILAILLVTGCSSNSTWDDPTSWYDSGWWGGDDEDPASAEDGSKIEDSYPELRSVPDAPKSGEREEIIEELSSADEAERRYDDQRGKADDGEALKPRRQAQASKSPPRASKPRASKPRASGKKASRASKPRGSKQRGSKQRGSKPRQSATGKPSVHPFDNPVPVARNTNRYRRSDTPPNPRRSDLPAASRALAQNEAISSPPISPFPMDDSALSPPLSQSFGSMDSADFAAPIVLVQFANGATRLTSAEKKKLQQHQDQIQRHAGMIRIVGHASSRTMDMDPLRRRLVNFDVSMKRAQHVAEVLTGMGIDFKSLVVEAHSDVNPIYRETMPMGEAANRRVEVFLIPAWAE